MINEQNEDEKERLLGGSGCWEQVFYNKKFQIFLVLVLCVFIGIGTPFIWQVIWNIGPGCCDIESDLRYDCFPEQTFFHKSEPACYNHSEQCCWDNNTSHQIQCYYGIVSKTGPDRMPGYNVSRSSEDSAELNIDKNAKDICRRKDDQDNRTLPVAFDLLSLTVLHYNDMHFSLKISPQNETVNYPNLYEELGLTATPISNGSKSAAKIVWKSETSEFSLNIKRKDSGHTIFNTGDFSPFIYCDGFIEITTLLPNDLIYGLGQSPSRSFQHNMTYPDDWTIFSKYNLNATLNNTSWFGAHPFYMGWTNDHNAYGVLLLNSHPIQLITNSRPSLTFRTIGGPLEFHFFLGPKPADVMKQLISLIGRPKLPPYWALGFNLCRTLSSIGELVNTTRLVNNLTQNGVPFDSDCGTASHSTLFSDDSGDIAVLKDYYHDLLSNHPNVNPLLVQVPQRKANTVNENKWGQLSLRNYSSGLTYQGQFFNWEDNLKDPNRVFFPSFDYKDAFNKLRDDLRQIIDLSTPIGATFLDYNTPLDLNSSCFQVSDNKWNNTYYKKLNENTPCLDLVDSKNHPLLSTHNLYGYRHMKAAESALEDKQKRKLIMSLSTFIGSGKIGGHIATNMSATWDMLLQTQIQTLDFNMYGIPLVGFPVCGFRGESYDKELCLRWYQLAALQPFMISHTGFGQNLTDPYSISKLDLLFPNSTLDALKSSLVIRYQLLPYLYTLFYWASIDGTPVVRPLFYDFPDDRRTYRIDKQYMLGSALMASPLFEPKVKSVNVYFPKNSGDSKPSIWYDFYSGGKVATKQGHTSSISAIENHVTLHLRGGSVIPTQNGGQNTIESRGKPFQIISGLDWNREAFGEVFIDDGISLDTTAPDKHLISRFSVKSNNITIDKSNKEIPVFDGISTQIDSIKIYGVIHRLNPPYFYIYRDIDGDNNLVPDDNNPYNKIYYNHNDYSGVLTLKKLNLDLLDQVQIFINWTYTDWEHLND